MSVNKSNNFIIRVHDDSRIDVKTSKGDALKFKVDDYWYKCNKFGYENIAEFITSELLNAIENIDYVKYDLCEINYKGEILNCCKSKNFLREGESLVTLSKLLMTYEPKFYYSFNKYSPLIKLKTLIRILKDIGLDLSNYLLNTLLFDSLVLNEDRHLSNLAVISGDGYFRECPIFDNGLSLLSDTKDYPFDVSTIENIAKVKSKPFVEDFKIQNQLIRNVLGDRKLKININKFYRNLENANVKNLGSYHRCLEVLKFQFDRLRGDVYEEV